MVIIFGGDLICDCDFISFCNKFKRPIKSQKSLSIQQAKIYQWTHSIYQTDQLNDDGHLFCAYTLFCL